MTTQANNGVQSESELFTDEHVREYVDSRLFIPRPWLAEANTWYHDKPLSGRAEDGILTAEDVSGMNLLDTEMAVLSACETGLGQEL
jgi:hypothetical protein